MSPAEIEALFAENAAAFGDAPEAAPADPASVADPAANAMAEALPDAASGSAPAPDALLDSTAMAAAQDATRLAPADAFGAWPEASSWPEPAPIPEAPAFDAVLTDTAIQAGLAAPVAGETAAEEDEAPAALASGHTTISGLFAQYGKYVALFVGAGLISGSVVHLPLAPARYAIIGTVGALVFAIASVVSELGDRNPLRLARVAVSSLALAVGIGMMSGSIQHFMDIPDRAALLIPLGVVLSLGAFGIRHGLRLKRTDLALIVPWLIIAVFALAFGLGKLADVAKAHGGGTGHGHDSGAADGHGRTEEDAGDGHGAADGHGAGGGEDAHAEDKADAKEAAAKGDAHAEEDVHAEDAHAEDAHAEDAHAEDAHAEDAHAEKASGAKKAAGSSKDSAPRAEDSHDGRLRLVP